MSFWGRFNLCWLAALTLIAVNGCLPSDSSQLDEEKEPHYVLGKSRVNALDYQGAIEAFTEALEVNPRSAAAHFQLACLFDTSKESDPAAAIYHYREYLRLNPNAENAGVVTQRIESCKVQLAANVVSLPSAPAAQRQLEDLAEKNRQLQAQVDHLNELNRQWSVYCATLKGNLSAAQPNSNPAPLTGSLMPDDMTGQPAAAGAANRPAAVSEAPRPVVAQPARPRTHTVAAGETLASIARKAGVSLAAIRAANPGINPKKMAVGATVKLP